MEGIVGSGGLIAVADALGDPAAGEIDLVDDLQGGDHAVHQSHVHHLADAGLLGVDVGGLHADGEAQARQHVADGGAAAGGAAAGPAGDAHEAAHGLGHDVVAGPVMIGAVLAEAGDAAVDQLGVDFLQHVIAQAQLLHGAGAEVLDEDIGLLYQILEDLLALGGLEIQGETALIAVEIDEVSAFPVKTRRIGAGIITLSGDFHLDDVGAHVREEHRAVRPRQNPGQINYGNAFQSSFVHCCDFPFLANADITCP